MADFWDGWTGTIRIGDGPEIPFVGPPPVIVEHDLDASRYLTAEEVNRIQAGGLRVGWSTPVEGDLDGLIQHVSDKVDRHMDRFRERRLGVDPDRVIDGETVQPARKEIEG